MKKINLLAICLACFSFVGCQNFHTGKVVVDEKNSMEEKNNREEKNINVEYIVVNEEDKDSLIKNIKEGKGAIIDKNKKATSSEDNKDSKDSKDNKDKKNSDNKNDNKKDDKDNKKNNSDR